MSQSGLDPAKAFLGVGWAFPVQADAATGDAKMVAYEEDIRQALLLILETEPGERVMRPDFGAGLRGLVFEPLSTTTLSMVQHRVQQALVTWEPRINLREVLVTLDASERGRLNIHIGYEVRSTNIFYNWVYPFYLQEGRG